MSPVWEESDFSNVLKLTTVTFLLVSSFVSVEMIWLLHIKGKAAVLINKLTLVKLQSHERSRKCKWGSYLRAGFPANKQERTQCNLIREWWLALHYAHRKKKRHKTESNSHLKTSVNVEKQMFLQSCEVIQTLQTPSSSDGQMHGASVSWPSPIQETGRLSECLLTIKANTCNFGVSVFPGLQCDCFEVYCDGLVGWCCAYTLRSKNMGWGYVRLSTASSWFKRPVKTPTVIGTSFVPEFKRCRFSILGRSVKESEVEGERSMEPKERVLKKDFRMSLLF